MRLTRYSDYVLIFVLSILIYAYILKFIGTDLLAHIAHVGRINNGVVSYPGNFLYYIVVNIFSGFSNNLLYMIFAAIFILSIATVAKYAISLNYLNHQNIKVNRALSYKQIKLITIALFFCFAIIDPYSLFVLKKFYLGKFVPLVWHNSTTIFLMPIALLTFIEQLRLFTKLDKTITFNNLIPLCLLILLNIIIKPSFLFVFIPVATLCTIQIVGLKKPKKLILVLSPYMIGAILIVIQYFVIYILRSGDYNAEESGILITTPFQVISNWLPMWYIPIMFLCSFALPITTAILYKDIFKYKPFQFSLRLMILGILISAFIAESGPRLYHGNFMWQNVVCTYILFLTTISFIIIQFNNNTISKNHLIILCSVILLHLISGVLYIIKIGLTNSFI